MYGDDPTLMLWQKWKAAHDQVERLFRRQQRLETALIATVGFPHVDIDIPDQDCVAAAFTIEEIDPPFGDAPENAEAKIRAKAVLPSGKRLGTKWTSGWDTAAPSRRKSKPL